MDIIESGKTERSLISPPLPMKGSEAGSVLSLLVDRLISDEKKSIPACRGGSEGFSVGE